MTPSSVDFCFFLSSRILCAASMSQFTSTIGNGVKFVGLLRKTTEGVAVALSQAQQELCYTLNALNATRAKRSSELNCALYTKVEAWRTSVYRAPLFYFGEQTTFQLKTVFGLSSVSCRNGIAYVFSDLRECYNNILTVKGYRRLVGSGCCWLAVVVTGGVIKDSRW